MMKYRSSNSFDAIDGAFQPQGYGSSIILHSPLTALSASPAYNHIAVGGKDIKILSLTNQYNDLNELTYQLKVQSSLQMKGLQKNSAIVDLKWHPLRDCDEYLASSATNGALIVWDLRKSVSKTKRIYQEHTRTVNRICWQPNEINQLWSGGQDSTIRGWDIRHANSWCEIKTSSEVRDIQVSPLTTNILAVGTNSGTIQLWDIKNLKSPLASVIAHDDIILSLKWHPKFKNVLASGGMDRMVKFWDINKVQKSLYSLQTTTSVSKILWRPNFPHQIATSSAKSDFTVNVWDIHNPYLPTLSYKHHTDIVTGMLWLNEGPNHLITCSKDCRVAVQVFQDAEQPRTRMKAVDFDISHLNDLAFVGTEINRTPLEASTFKLSPLISSSDADVNQKFTPQPFNGKGNSFLEILHDVSTDSSSLSSKNKFEYYAKNYIYYDPNYTVQEKCLYNANISAKINDFQKEKVWLLLKLFHAEYVENIEQNAIQKAEKYDINESLNISQDYDSALSSESDEGDLPFTLRFPFRDHDEEQITVELQNEPRFFEKNSDSDDSSEGESSKLNFSDSPLHWSSPRGRSQSDKELRNGSKKTFVPSLQIFSHTNEKVDRDRALGYDKLQLSQVFVETLLNLLQYYTDNGDLQMAVAIVSALEKESPVNFSKKTLLIWQLNYIELLRKRKLFIHASRIIKYSNQEEIRNMSLNSTTIQSSCSDCGRPVEGYNQTTCEKCKKTFACFVCHLTYPGMWFFCQHCGCGGHLDCMMSIFHQQGRCPKCLAPPT